MLAQPHHHHMTILLYSCGQEFLALRPLTASLDLPLQRSLIVNR
jgi:hypothetical protein